MPPVSLCVLVLEVDNDSDPPNLSYKANKYVKMSGPKKSDEDEPSLPYDCADKTKVKGLRQSKTLSIETFLKDEAASGGEAKQPDCEGTRKVQFFSGNPFVEVTKGIIHLYKENEPTCEEGEKSEMLCMMNIPASMSCRELLQFVAPLHDDLEHIKIIRDNFPNQYMVLLKFNGPTGADAFYNNYNGVKFNSIEDDLCHLAYVARVESLKESEGAGLPLTGHTELPTCPVCLERMEESVDGVLTILCNHSFHSNCLAKWSDASCPVCRYVQVPEVVNTNECFECKSGDSPWICLICGHIGCGRYVQGHAFKHFCETGHCYAIQPDNHRVWDYVGDNFVHRILHNKSDGKLVAVPGGGCEEDPGYEGDAGEDKMDNMQLEFTYLLTTQLEAQRTYFEERLNHTRTDFEKEILELKRKIEELGKEKTKLDQRLGEKTKEFLSMERKYMIQGGRLTKANSELRDERELSRCLREDQVKMKGMLADLETKQTLTGANKDAELQDLKEQVRDLMFYLEAQKQIEDSPLKAEIEEGSVVVPEAKEETGKGSRKGGKERRKKK